MSFFVTSIKFVIWKSICFGMSEQVTVGWNLQAVSERVTATSTRVSQQPLRKPGCAHLASAWEKVLFITKNKRIMKKFSFLIVCLCAGMTFVSQAQDTERVAPAGSDAPSLNGARPSPWERPIGPGPRPIQKSNGGSGSGDVTDDGDSSGSPLDGLVKGTVKPDGGDAPSLQRRPRDWDEPIPGPIPHRLGDWDMDDGDSGNPHSLVGTSPDGLVKGSVKPDGGDAPSLQRKPREWDEPIGPRPDNCDWDVDDGDSGNPHRLVGTSPDGLVKGSIKPGGNGGGGQLNGGLRPGLDHPVIRPRPLVNAPGKTPKGITMVTGMIDGMINGSTDVDDVNGDGKSDVKDVTVLIDWLLSTK